MNSKLAKFIYLVIYWGGIERGAGGSSCLRFSGLERGSPLSIDVLTIAYKHLIRKVHQSFARENSEISGVEREGCWGALGRALIWGGGAIGAIWGLAG